MRVHSVARRGRAQQHNVHLLVSMRMGFGSLELPQRAQQGTKQPAVASFHVRLLIHELPFCRPLQVGWTRIGAIAATGPRIGPGLSGGGGHHGRHHPALRLR